VGGEPGPVAGRLLQELLDRLGIGRLPITDFARCLPLGAPNKKGGRRLFGGAILFDPATHGSGRQSSLALRRRPMRVGIVFDASGTIPVIREFTEGAEIGWTARADSGMRRPLSFGRILPHRPENNCLLVDGTPPAWFSLRESAGQFAGLAGACRCVAIRTLL